MCTDTFSIIIASLFLFPSYASSLPRWALPPCGICPQPKPLPHQSFQKLHWSVQPFRHHWRQSPGWWFHISLVYKIIDSVIRENNRSFSLLYHFAVICRNCTTETIENLRVCGLRIILCFYFSVSFHSVSPWR